ncbi:MAG TPA: hypothetical protein VD997_08225 [Phycisphaerales bacterium]|nr:hypothetical protein [Phycisphaerales bacterium]
MSDDEDRTVIPRKDQEAIEFFEAHWPIWQTEAAAIGLDADTVLQIKNATSAARASLSTQTSAKSAAKAATTGLRNTMRELRGKGGDGIRTIKAFAATTNNPSVFERAQIPEPAEPAPTPPPTQPTGFKVELTPEGGIRLSWKSTGSSGGFYSISRKLSGESAFTLIGNSGKKFYVDSTIPAGVSGATYIVQGWRGQTAGTPSNQLTIQFGVGGGGFASVKLAA